MHFFTIRVWYTKSWYCYILYVLLNPNVQLGKVKIRWNTANILRWLMQLLMWMYFIGLPLSDHHGFIYDSVFFV